MLPDRKLYVTQQMSLSSNQLLIRPLPPPHGKFSFRFRHCSSLKLAVFFKKAAILLVLLLLARRKPAHRFAILFFFPPARSYSCQLAGLIVAGTYAHSSHVRVQRKAQLISVFPPPPMPDRTFPN